MKQKDSSILKKAIQGLPVYHLENDEAWSTVSNRMDQFETIHKKLPVFEAPKEIWGRIEERLNETGVMDNVKKSTPVSSILKNKTGISIKIKYSVAASIALLLGLGIWKYIYHIEMNGTIIYTVESSETIEKFQPEINDDTQNTMNTIISQNCKFRPQVCKTSLYKSLDQQLNDIKKEIETMEPMIKGGDPQLLKYFYRLNNERVEIEKRMVKIIMQS